MALTKSAGAVDAKAKARERAAAFRDREAKLETLAVDYFTASDRIDTINSDLEETIVKLRERAADKAASERADLNAAIAGMAALDVSASEIAERLDLTVSMVRAALRAAREDAGSEPAELPEAGTLDAETPSTEPHGEPKNDSTHDSKESAEWAA
ncbi:hypothetical protein ASF48_17755 [Rathayibacter sp. Leaf299]|nr:hypothetical protein ASF48_17755 [Rathayibacter sp. Leaf299]